MHEFMCTRVLDFIYQCQWSNHCKLWQGVRNSEHENMSDGELYRTENKLREFCNKTDSRTAKRELSVLLGESNWVRMRWIEWRRSKWVSHKQKRKRPRSSSASRDRTSAMKSSPGGSILYPYPISIAFWNSCTHTASSQQCTHHHHYNQRCTPPPPIQSHCTPPPLQSTLHTDQQCGVPAKEHAVQQVGRLSHHISMIEKSSNRIHLHYIGAICSWRELERYVVLGREVERLLGDLRKRSKAIPDAAHIEIVCRSCEK